ncbi:transglycosylase SLT domain-containing protein [Streptomyces sp. N35]|uniref:transglycosylase SLT domain-containing protein n=1 Tax=Streptomyces sp. N35 TaxID=2795730 RepID=UPI0027DB7178|nr:transglycosylase SLT domain-containing protein [Streptomyces sp. N35]
MAGIAHQQDAVAKQVAAASRKAEQAEQAQKAEKAAREQADAKKMADAKKQADAERHADAKKQADSNARKAKEAKQAKDAAAEADAKMAAAGSAAAAAAIAAGDASVTESYSNDLHGWISEALDIMASKNIPGSYEGLLRNIQRESSGDPRAINNWDINAQRGTPSIGLLQVIQPTFDAYHVPGTPHDIYHPVSNITAAANYAAARYGSIDNVNGPY